MSIRSYRDLRVWQRGMDLVAEVYEVTREFPQEERFGLTSQMRRSAISVPSNIAEGFGRESNGDFARFLRVAQGSLKELETQLLVSQRLDMLAADDADATLGKCDEIGRILRGLISKVRDDQRTTTDHRRP